MDTLLQTSFRDGSKCGYKTLVTVLSHLPRSVESYAALAAGILSQRYQERTFERLRSVEHNVKHYSEYLHDPEGGIKATPERCTDLMALTANQWRNLGSGIAASRHGRICPGARIRFVSTPKLQPELTLPNHRMTMSRRARSA